MTETTRQVLEDPCVRYAVKDALSALLGLKGVGRDPVDMLRDAELVLAVVRDEYNARMDDAYLSLQEVR